MVDLDKKHDPLKNESLISKYIKDSLEHRDVSNQTNRLFKNFNKEPVQIASEKMTFGSLLKNIAKGIVHVFLASSKKDSGNAYDSLFDEHDRAYPQWLKLLEREYQKLLTKANREVNVLDFGAVGDGKTDDTEAFRKAIGRGRVTVRIPAGQFITRGIRLPSWTILAGEGKGKTIIKLHDDAPKGTRLITALFERESPLLKRWDESEIKSGVSLDTLMI